MLAQQVSFYRFVCICGCQQTKYLSSFYNQALFILHRTNGAFLFIILKGEIKKCLAACEKSLRENEYNTRKLKGVDCSHSDVETVILYAQTIQRNGTYEGELMRPHGAVEDILRVYNLLPN